MNEQRIPWRWVLPYASMVAPVSIIGMPMVVFVPIYYIEEIGLGAATVGTLFILARVWDILTDPPMGLILDRAQSPWGKHKHWILLATPLMMGGAALIYFPQPGADAVYLGGSLLLLYTSYTLMFMSQLSWGAELAPNYNERIRLFSMREIVSIISMITVLCLPLLVTYLGGSEAARFHSIGLYMLILVVPVILWALIVLPDRRSSQESQVDWKEGLKILAANHNMRRVLIAEIASSVTQGVQGSLFFLMCTHLFDVRDQRFALLLFYFLCSIFGVPFWQRLAERLQKHQAFIIAGRYIILMQLCVLAVGVAAIYGWSGSVITFWVVIGLAGLAFGAPPILVRSLMSDIIDRDELSYGKRRSGLLFALTTTCSKIGVGMSPVVLIILEVAFGYDAALPEQDDLMRWGLLGMYVIGSISVYLVLLWQLSGYDLTRERHSEIQRELEARNAASQASAAGQN
ncbi:MAG: MFS transporter [Gammaproteobacteria bacterium AqS3]|nr:MFS transporter [Gammaproteobacteria bacterium AqS3]